MAVGEAFEREERPAYVRFERVAVEDKRASLEAGRSVSKDVDYALITPPYSKDLVRMRTDRWLTTLEYELKNNRVPQKWVEQWKAAYEAWKNGQELPLNGTAIKEWSAISPAKIKNLIGLGIYTVEDLAICNDQGLSRIGMGARELKQKAVNWLSAAKDHGPLTLKVTQLEVECERLKITNEDLVEKNRILKAQLESAGTQIAEVPRGAISLDDIIPDEFEMKPVHAVKTENQIKHDDFARPSTKSLERLYESMSHEDLVVAFREKIGKDPHPKAKDETIRKRLLE